LPYLAVYTTYGLCVGRRSSYANVWNKKKLDFGIDKMGQYLVKPFTPEVLKEKIEIVMGLK